MEEDDSLVRINNIINKVGSSLSILGSMLSILICLKYRNLKNFCLELILHLSINTLISGIPSFLNPDLKEETSLKYGTRKKIFE